MTHTWTISFSAIECRRCGETRPRRISCPDCGLAPDPREVDQKLNRRRRIVAKAHEVECSVPDASTPIEIIQAMGAALDTLLETMTRVADDDCAESEAAESLSRTYARLSSVAVGVASARRLRPFVQTWPLWEQAENHLEACADNWVGALTEDVPIKAQRQAEIGQRHLDQAAEQMRLLHDLMEIVGAFDGDPHDAFVILSRRARERAGPGAGSVRELVAAARPLVAGVVGDEPDENLLTFGPFLLLEAERAHLFLDEVRYWETATAAYELFNDQWLTVLAADPEWQATIEEVVAAFVDSGQRFGSVLSDAYNERQENAAWVQLGRDLLEGPIKRLLRIGLAIHRSRLLKGVPTDVGAVLQQCSQAGLPCPPETARSVRNAGAHDDYRSVDGRLVLHPSARNERRLAPAELLDEVAAIEETASALLSGFSLACLANSIPTASSWPGRLSDLIAATVPVLGLDVESVVEEDDSITVTTSGVLESGAITAVAGAVAMLPERVARISLVNDAGRLDIMTAPLRRFATLESPDKEDQLIVVMAGALYNGESIVSREAGRLWLGYHSLKAVHELEPRAAITRLRKMKALATELGDPDARRQVELLIGGVRRKLMGTAQDEFEAQAVQSAIDEMVAWSKRKITWPPLIQQEAA